MGLNEEERRIIVGLEYEKAYQHGSPTDEWYIKMMRK